MTVGRAVPPAGPPSVSRGWPGRAGDSRLLRAEALHWEPGGCAARYSGARWAGRPERSGSSASFRRQATPQARGGLSGRKRAQWPPGVSSRPPAVLQGPALLHASSAPWARSARGLLNALKQLTAHHLPLFCTWVECLSFYSKRKGSAPLAVQWLKLHASERIGYRFKAPGRG